VGEKNRGWAAGEIKGRGGERLGTFLQHLFVRMGGHSNRSVTSTKKSFLRGDISFTSKDNNHQKSNKTTRENKRREIEHGKKPGTAKEGKLISLTPSY